MLKLLRQLAAPERYPWPKVTKAEFPSDEDTPEQRLEKLRYLEQQAAEGQRALAWRAQVHGWHHALMIIAGFNALMVPLTVWWKPIEGEHYGLVMVLLVLFMSLFSKRLIR